MKNSLTPDLMVLLSQDEADFVRMRVACNKKAPIHLLEQLSNDPSVDVSTAALERLKWRKGDSE